MRSILLIIKGEGNPAALLDVMPMSSFASGLALACTTAACWAIMYQSSLLSEIEEVVETEQSRWIRDEKTGSLC